MKAGFASSWAASISGSRSFPARDISVVGNGTSCARSETVPCRCFGSQTARRDFAAGKPGAGRSPINPNSTMPQTGRTVGKRGSSPRLIADLDPDEWDLPPKPKWMRWATYNRYSADTTTMKTFWTRVHRAGGQIPRKIISFEINGGLQVSQEISILSRARIGLKIWSLPIAGTRHMSRSRALSRLRRRSRCYGC